MAAHRKTVIIGAGHVGSHCAFSIASSGIGGEVILIDKDREKAKAQAMDIADSTGEYAGASSVRHGDYIDCADADVTVIAVGAPRLPGQTRLDVLDASAVMIREVADEFARHAPSGIVVSITNPADVIAARLCALTGLSPRRCFSTGTLLDTARLRRTVSEMTGYAVSSVSGFSMGEHGDSSMIPFSHLSVGGIPFEKLGLSRDILLSDTRIIGMDIINGKGSTEFGIGSVCATLIRCIYNDERRVMPLSTALNGEYGERDVFAGVPCIIGRNGIEKIIELSLTDDEKEMFHSSCEVIRTHIRRAESL